MIESLNQTAADWSQMILHASWQSALVAGLVFLLLILTRRIMSSQLRYALLLVVLVKFATPPFLNFPTGVVSQYSNIRSQPISSEPIYLVESSPTIETKTSAQTNRSLNNSPVVAVKPDLTGTEPDSKVSMIPEVTKSAERVSWSTMLMSVYLCGTSAFLILLVQRYRFVRRIVQSGEIQRDGFLFSELTRISKRLKIQSLPELRISNNTDAPFAIGAFRPVIVLPRLIEEQLQPDQLTIVIAHELAHIRRRDLLIGWFETLVSIFWWFHPAMWWLRKSLRQTREDCCDDILLANQLAEPERYCETLIDAAARQATKLTEPLVLGFVHREHPVARRIRRLMDGSLFRGDRLRFPAMIFTLLLALIVLPGMRPERQPVTQTTLQGLFGWSNLPFQIDASEEAVITECRKIAQTYFSTKNNQRIFSRKETREKLEAILEKYPKCFYAQYLLGTWYRLNGDLELSTKLLNESLANAPLVLTQKFKFGNGAPLKGVVIPQLGIECNRVENHSLDPSLALNYVGLLTDSDGSVFLPVYDTVYRMNSLRYPSGYFAETNRMGWFESKALNGILPAIMVWRKWSQPRYFTRTAAESSILSDAKGTDSLELASEPNTYKLGGVTRGQANGTMTLENGKGKSLSSLSTELPVIKNGAFMDHALIHLSEPRPSRFNIAKVQILDSQTKIPLQKFQDGAGFTWTDKSKIHLFSMWDTLPAIIDLVLEVHNYDENAFRYKIPPKVGTTGKHAGTAFEMTYLAEGNHEGWDSRNGFSGEAQSTASTSEIIFEIKGARQIRVSLWVVSKDGRKQDLNNNGWLSSGTYNGPIRIMLPLDEIDHFELLPYVKPVTIYFEKIQLPVRKTLLDQRLPAIEFPIEGVALKFKSDLFSPMIVHFESQRGKRFSGSSSGMNGFGLIERPEDEHFSKSNTTVTWEYWSTIDVDHRLEFSVKSDTGKKSRDRSFGTSLFGTWGAAGANTKDAPLESVEAVGLQFLPKKID